MDTFVLAFEASPAYFYTVVAVFGLLIGSFLNVVAIRVPKGLSVVRPPSHCTSCGHRLGPKDLMPVISYFLAGGKCRYCGESFSIGYAVGELATGAAFVLTAAYLGPSQELWVGLLLVSLLIVIIQTDLRYMLIPDKIVFFGMTCGILLRLFIHPLPLWNYAAAFVIGGGSLLLLAWLGERILKKESMGGGDIKLLAMLGFFLGIKGILLTIFIGSLLGTVAGMLLIAAKRLERGQYMAFGPYLAAGAYVAYLWGDSIINAYVTLMLSVGP